MSEEAKNIPINLLAVSVGNTRTRVGSFVAGQLTETATFINGNSKELDQSLDHAFGPLQGKNDVAVLLSSVNPTISDEVEKQISESLGLEITRTERDINIPIGRQLDPEAIVGEDRLLNAAGAFDVLEQACIVIDAGTAITVDFVDGKGTFHGGAIAPGAQSMLDTMATRTAYLPEIELKAPKECIGHNTQEAMRSGVFHSMRGMVHELVELYAQEAGAFPMVVATGGDANLLFREYELVNRIVPNLTLMGLAVTWKTNNKSMMGDG